MSFLWPIMLVSLLAVPAVVALYLRTQRRRRALASAFRTVGGQGAWNRVPGFRRHLPSALFLLGLVVILVALARPQAQLSLPRVEGTVMLVFDVSASMGAADVEPTRLEAAKMAAREFVLAQPTTVRIGIVSFSGNGFTVQQPTNDTGALLASISRLKPTSGTSLGQGIASALQAIAIDAGMPPVEGVAAGTPVPSRSAGSGAQAAGPPQQNLLEQLPEGAYPASAIVLLSDGENNQSIDPLEAAQAAAERGVRVHALGFGTPAGTVLEVEGYRVHTALDEAALQSITQVAGGSYYAAQGEHDPKQVYASLTPQVVVKPEDIEITAVFAGASILIMLVGSLLSTLWFGRLV